MPNEKKYLTGEIEIILASARPAARSFYLLYAEALEDMLAKNVKATLSCSTLKEKYDEAVKTY